MITYKGQKTVIGKRFIYDGEILKYTGKIYGDSYGFINSNNVEYILTESDLDNLQDYGTINEISGKEKVKKTIIDYTEKELALLNDIIAGKSNDINALTDLYEKELSEIRFLNKYDLPKMPKDDVTLEAQKSYLDELNRNISTKSIIAVVASLDSFIASNKKGAK